MISDLYSLPQKTSSKSRAFCGSSVVILQKRMTRVVGAQHWMTLIGQLIDPFCMGKPLEIIFNR